MGNYSECVKCNNLITCNRKEYKADRCLHFEERKSDVVKRIKDNEVNTDKTEIKTEI